MFRVRTSRREQLTDVLVSVLGWIFFIVLFGGLLLAAGALHLSRTEGRLFVRGGILVVLIVGFVLLSLPELRRRPPPDAGRHKRERRVL